MISEVISVLEKNSDPERALRMKAYMKGQFEYYGIQAPERKMLVKEFIKSHRNTDYHTVKKIITDLWHHPYRDAQYTAMELYGKHLKLLEDDDDKFLHLLLTTKSWWDTVDWLASHGVGTYLKLYPQKTLNLINIWSDSENIWLIRTCIIHQLFYKKDTDEELLAALILKHVGTKEFFINKASGWALRQYSKVNPMWVNEFISKYDSKLSNLTKKEGLKWIKKNI